MELKTTRIWGSRSIRDFLNEIENTRPHEMRCPSCSSKLVNTHRVDEMEMFQCLERDCVTTLLQCSWNIEGEFFYLQEDVSRQLAESLLESFAGDSNIHPPETFFWKMRRVKRLKEERTISLKFMNWKLVASPVCSGSFDRKIETLTKPTVKRKLMLYKDDEPVAMPWEDAYRRYSAIDTLFQRVSSSSEEKPFSSNALTRLVFPLKDSTWGEKAGAFAWRALHPSKTNEVKSLRDSLVKR